MNAPVIAPQSRDIAPGFHFLRHFLSIIILGFHSYVATFGGIGNSGYVKGALLATAGQLTGKQLLIEALRPGLFALVAMFFALSGYLVVGSALRTRDVRQFFTLRALRILPALCTEVALSAFILGPIVTEFSLHDYFNAQETYTYFGNIIGSIQYELPGVFLKNPVANIVNVNLWTLHAEFFCYLMIGVLMLSGLLYKSKSMTALIVVGLLLSSFVSAIPAFDIPTRFDTTHFQSWFLVVMFAVGMLFRIQKIAVPIRFSIFGLCVFGYFSLIILGLCDTLAGVLLTYIMVYLGTLRFAWFDKIFSDDCSYGIYLYGYPITQTVIFFLSDRLVGFSGLPKLAIVMSLSIGSTFCFALLSWRVIEKPALKLKSILLPVRSAGRGGTLHLTAQALGQPKA